MRDAITLADVADDTSYNTLTWVTGGTGTNALTMSSKDTASVYLSPDSTEIIKKEIMD